ncbi:MAG: hypothetical protein ACE5ER_12845, partial [Nitrospinaceae bacterium]
AFWDLLTGIWKRGGQVRKTDAAKLMVGIKSAQTAAKYVESALEQRILQETENPKDARSRLVVLTPEMKWKLDAFFNKAVTEMRKASDRVASLGPASIES